MDSFALALVLATALGLLFVATRWLSVVGAALLCLFYPLAFFAFLLLAGIAFVLFHYYRR